MVPWKVLNSLKKQTKKTPKPILCDQSIYPKEIIKKSKKEKKKTCTRFSIETLLIIAKITT